MELADPDGLCNAAVPLPTRGTPDGFKGYANLWNLNIPAFKVY